MALKYLSHDPNYDYGDDDEEDGDDMDETQEDEDEDEDGSDDEFDLSDDDLSDDDDVSWKVRGLSNDPLLSLAPFLCLSDLFAPTLTNTLCFPFLFSAPLPFSHTHTCSLSHSRAHTYSLSHSHTDTHTHTLSLSLIRLRVCQVRRAAAKFIHTAVVTRSDLLLHFATEAAPVLVKQFREREDNALEDVLRTYAALLHQIKLVEGRDAAVFGGDGADSSARAAVETLLPAAVQRGKKHMAHKNMKCRAAVLDVFCNAAALFPGALAPHAAALFPGIQACLSDKAVTATVKQAALGVIDEVVKSHNADLLMPNLQQLAALLVIATSDAFYKTVARALAVATRFVWALRAETDAAQPAGPAEVEAVNTLLGAVRVQFVSDATDLEVRAQSILCVGEVLARFGECLDASTRGELLETLIGRLRHEMTRAVGARALETVCTTPGGAALPEPVARDAMATLTEYLRLANKALRNTSIKTLTALVARHPAAVGAEGTARVLEAVTALITAEDQQGAALALGLVASCVVAHPPCVADVQANLLPGIAAVVGAKSMSEAHLSDVCACLETLVAHGVPHSEIEALLVAQCKDASQSKATIRFLATASACAARAVADVQAAVCERSFAELGAARSEADQLYHLYTLAALGTQLDIARANPSAFETVQQVLEGSGDDLRLAAAHTLGGLAAGSPAYVATLLDSIQHSLQREQQQQQQQQQSASLSSGGADELTGATSLYVLALKQAVQEMTKTVEGMARLKESAGSVWATLAGLMDHRSENVRTLVSEALATVCLLDVQHYTGTLGSALQHEDARVRACAINVVRFLLSQGGADVRFVLRPLLPPFLRAIGDADNDVRRVALGAFKAAVLNHISLVIGEDGTWGLCCLFYFVLFVV